MSKGWMPNVVNQSECLGEFGVQIQRSGDRARDLGDFDRVGEAVAKMIRKARAEDLRLGF